jgi:hypothetical protein
MPEEEKNPPQQQPSDDSKKESEPGVPSEKQGDVVRDQINISEAQSIAIGDGASIHHHHQDGVPYEQVFRSYEQVLKSQQSQIDSITKAYDALLKNMNTSDKSAKGESKLFESLRYKREQVVTENEVVSAAASIDDVIELPKTLEDLEEWYDGLSDYEQCFVQAVSVLHGAPLLDVSDAAGKLYQPPHQSSSAPQEETISQASTPSSSASRRSLRREMFKHTRVTTRRVNYVERTFWRTTDLEEQQAFTLRMLRFYADEFAISYGETRFSDTLRDWAESMRGECSRKAARSLGIVLYHQSADELWRTANAWAESNAGGWQLAAAALNGAYDIHKLEDEKGADDTRKSPIFRLLNQWVDRAQDARNPRVGCAAANAYGLIGQKAPDPAFNGLESLLCFPESAAGTDWESISLGVWVESVSNYVGLAWSGYIREVLSHLASYAEKLIFQRQRPERESEREAYRRRCKLNLEAIFDIFFPIALSSLIGARDDISVSYSLTEPLPEQPEVPDEQGRDTLLAGILTESEPYWYNCIATLLCAAIFAGKVSVVSFFMRQWAEVVLKDCSSDKEQLETAYLNFVKHVGNMIYKWQSDLKTMRLGPPLAFGAFTHNLRLWQRKNLQQPTDTFIQKVLTDLNAQ